MYNENMTHQELFNNDGVYSSNSFWFFFFFNMVENFIFHLKVFNFFDAAHISKQTPFFSGCKQAHSLDIVSGSPRRTTQSLPGPPAVACSVGTLIIITPPPPPRINNNNNPEKCAVLSLLTRN